ncbi:unnamed protein product [Caenorhabditis nigoni]
MNAVHGIPDPLPATVIAIQPQPNLPPSPDLDPAGSVPIGVKEISAEPEESSVCCHCFWNDCCCEFLVECLRELVVSISICCCEICCDAICSCD